MEAGIRTAFAAAGKEDQWKAKSELVFLPNQQIQTQGLPYLALTETIHRYRPGGALYVGSISIETLPVAEAIAEVGAIGICGTSLMSNIQFVGTIYDYSLVGEELFAAGAYASNDPVQLGTLRSEDLWKTGSIILMLITIISVLGKFSIIPYLNR